MFKTIALASMLAASCFGAKLGYLGDYEENGYSIKATPAGWLWTTPQGSRTFKVDIDGGQLLFMGDSLVMTGSLTGDPVYFALSFYETKTHYCCADGWPIPQYPAAWPDHVQERDPISFEIKNYWVYRQWHLVYWGPNSSRVGSVDTFEEKYYFLTPEPATIGLFAAGGLVVLWRRVMSRNRAGRGVDRIGHEDTEPKPGHGG